MQMFLVVFSSHTQYIHRFHQVTLLRLHLYLSASQMWRFWGNTWFLHGNSWRTVSPQAGGPTKWWAGLWALGYQWGGRIHHFPCNGWQAAAVCVAEEVDTFCRRFSAVHWSRNTPDNLEKQWKVKFVSFTRHTVKTYASQYTKWALNMNRSLGKKQCHTVHLW